MKYLDKLKKIILKSDASISSINEDYWTGHTVQLHESRNRDESLNYFRWRNTHCLFYDELMPFSGLDGQVVLDYGCGPGHDLVGFAEFSRPRRIIGMDVSSTALDAAKKRMKHHDGIPVDFILISEGASSIPLETASIDYIHSSGVLHHTSNMEDILREFHRLLKSDGKVRIMVYNYDSIWLHLYVAYQTRLCKGIDMDIPLEDAFRRSTDGKDCPISYCYKHGDFLRICRQAGFQGEYLGSSISLHEMSLLPLRYEALADIRLAAEHRDFLKSITFDKYGRPLYQSSVAGINAHFELTLKA